MADLTGVGAVPGVIDVTLANWAMIATIVVLLVASAGLAMSETSLVRTTRAKAMALVEDGRRGAKRLAWLVERPQEFLNAVLLLVLVCQLVVATLVGILAERWFGGWGVALATVFEVIVIFVLAELIPKNWAVHNSERAALMVAPVVSAVVGFPPVRVLSRALVGLANLLIGPSGAQAAVSESELLAMADVAVEEQVIETDERALIHSIIDFGDTVVREVMVPRPDMRTVDASQSVTEALATALSVGFSRLPAHDGNVDDIVGIAYVKDLVRAEREGRGDEPVKDHVRRAQFVPESKRVAGLMRQMQEEKFHMAIVVDEYGGTAGLVTLEDLIEELVGEIVDEFDVEEPPYVPLGGGEVSVSARMSVDELTDRLGVELPEGDYDTVGGLIFAILGTVPAQGEVVDVNGLRLVAERVEGNRIRRVKVAPRYDAHAEPAHEALRPEPGETDPGVAMGEGISGRSGAIHPGAGRNESR